MATTAFAITKYLHNKTMSHSIDEQESKERENVYIYIYTYTKAGESLYFASYTREKRLTCSLLVAMKMAAARVVPMARSRRTAARIHLEDIFIEKTDFFKHSLM